MGTRTFTAQAPTVTNAALISPVADHLMIGGASIIAFCLYWLFVDSSNNKSGVVEAAFWLTFLINSPHFLSSYQLLYGDNKQHILKKKSFFWAAIIVPMLLIGALVYGAKSVNVRFLGLLAQGMYLSVGWHYVKQIFGTAVVTSAAQKRFFTVWERNLILLNLYSLWAVSWVSNNLQKSRNSLDGLFFYSLRLPGSLLTFSYACVAVTLLATIYISTKKYIDTGVRPATTALVSFASIYVWFIPSFYHPHFSVMIPFFHSLQYMLFVVAMKKNQVEAQGANLKTEPEKRFVFMRGFWGFLLLAGILGALAFNIVPNTLDKWTPFMAEPLGPTFWLFSIAIFINIHHYFIDNVIWRGDNDMLKNHLVLASQKRAL